MWVVYAAQVIGFAQLPLLSNDIFSVMAYGSAAAAGIDPYTVTDAALQTPFAPYVSDFYKNTPCVYGPLNLLVAEWSARLGGHTLWGTFWVYKLLVLATCLGTAQLLKDSFWGKLLLISPLWIIQAAGQAHNEIFGVACIFWGIWLLQKRQFIMAAMPFALAFLAKLTFVLLIPLPIVWLLMSNNEGKTLGELAISPKTWIQSFKNIALAKIGIIAIVVAGYAAFWSGPETLTMPLKTLGSLRPSSSYADIIGEVSSGVSQAFSASPLSPEAAKESKEAIWSFGVKAFQLLALLAMLYWVWLARHTKYFQHLMVFFAGAVCIFLCLYSHRFMPWYLLTLIPLVAYSQHRDWLIWLLVVGSVATAQDMSQIPTRDTIPAMAIIGVSLVSTLILFAWKLKPRTVFTD